MPRRPDMPCADCGKLMWRGKGALPEGQARCRECRSRNQTERHGTATGYKSGCRCAECREAKRVEMARYVEQVRARDGLSPTQKYRPAKSPDSRRTRPGVCSKCGAAMGWVRLDAPLCAPCRYNSAGRNIKINRSGRVAIYERDRWTCQICLEPVDPGARPNTTWDATLDHIVPRSKGGDDSPENLRLAHRWCNSVRGDLSHYADADLRVA